MKTVFILGAGVSCEAGVPGLQDFLPVMFGKVKNHYRGDKEIIKKFDEVKKYMHENLGRCNVEELLSFLDFMSTITDRRGAYGRIIRSYLRSLIIKTIIKTLDKTPEERKDKVYSTFVETVMKERHSVITFNWDLLLEMASDWKVNYGTNRLVHETENNQFDGSELILLKLHGSMNWDDLGKTDKILWRKMKFTGDNLNSPLIILPTYNKFVPEKIDNQRVDHYRFLGEIWDKALEEISKADRLFVVGFSFPETDPQFRIFLKHAINKNKETRKKDLEVYVITRPKRKVRDKLEFEDRYTRIMETGMGVQPRFRYMTFSRFVNYLSVDDMDIFLDIHST